jgi:hypothetical protein
MHRKIDVGAAGRRRVLIPPIRFGIAKKRGNVGELTIPAGAKTYRMKRLISDRRP